MHEMNKAQALLFLRYWLCCVVAVHKFGCLQTAEPAIPGKLPSLCTSTALNRRSRPAAFCRMKADITQPAYRDRPKRPSRPAFSLAGASAASPPFFPRPPLVFGRLSNPLCRFSSPPAFKACWSPPPVDCSGTLSVESTEPKALCVASPGLRLPLPDGRNILPRTPP
jgi:hypothetical protein